MSLNKVRQVHADKGFKIFDLIIYGAIIVLVTVLFIAVFTTRDKSPLSGFRITVGDTVVFDYSFDDDAFDMDENYIEITEAEQDKIIFVVHTEREGENTVLVDKSARSVEVTHANCGSKDCTVGALKNNSGFIYCVPHSLRIVPYDFDPDSPDINI